MVDVKRLGLLPQTDPREGLLAFSTPRPSTLGAWSSLERLEEVGKVWRKRGESKEQGAS